MFEWFHYGSTLDQLSAGSPDLVVADGGRAIVALSRENKYVPSSPSLLDCVDVATGRVARAGLVAAAAVAGAEVVASLPDGRVRVLRVPELVEVAGFELGAAAVAIAADAATIVAALAGDAPALVLVDRATQARRRVALSATPEDVALSPDGRRAAVALASKAIVIADVADAAIVATLKGARAPIRGMAWSPASDRVSAGAGKTVLSWELAGKTPKAAPLRKGKQDLHVVGCTAQGLVVSTGYKEELGAIDAATGVTAWSIPQYGPAAVTGDRVASVRFKELRQVDAATGAIVRAVAAPSYMDAVAVSGDLLVTGTRGSRVQIVSPGATEWPAARGAGHDEQVLDACCDGARFATTGFDGRVIVWERGRAAPLATIQPGDGNAEACVIDGETLLTSFNYGVQRWRIGDGARLAATTRHLKTEVMLVCPVPEHEVIVVATRASRGAYGGLYVLAADTLAFVYQDERIDRTYRRARRLGGGRVELAGDYQRIVFDVGALAVEATHLARTDDYSRSPHLTRDGTVLVEIDTRPFRGETYETRLYARDLASDAQLYEPVYMPQVVSGADLADDDRLLTPHADGLRVWNIRAGTLLAHVTTPFVPYGACWCGDQVLCWDRTGALVGAAI